MPNAQVKFKHLETLEQRLSVFPLYHQLNPRMTEGVFKIRMEKMMLEPGYSLLAMVLGDSIIGISGYWISHKIYCGKYLEPDNVVVDSDFRSQGFGEMLQKELERIAEANHCEAMMLDAYMANVQGHKFYERHGYVKKGFHFVRRIGD